MSKHLRSLALLPLVVLLVACGSASEEELRQWMAQQRSEIHPKIKPISEPKQFKPENYTTEGELEPFSSQKLTQALKRDSSQAASNGALIAPELARRKEPLEEFPLDAMVMVGSLQKEGKPAALIMIGKMLYQVQKGNHLGLSYGLITKITETEVSLREIVQDAAGEWIERPASLQLQERLNK